MACDENDRVVRRKIKISTMSVFAFKNITASLLKTFNFYENCLLLFVLFSSFHERRVVSVALLECF